MDDETRAEIASLAQAFLFAEGGTLTKKRLSQMVEAEDPVLESALEHLAQKLEGSGLTLIVTASEVMLAVAPRQSEVLSDIYQRELGREIGDAGLEVLAILLYRGPSTKAQIDYIRGVNTSSTIRSLQGRGLITRTGNPSDAREFVYQATPELLAHVGSARMQDLPEYGRISSELLAFEPSVEAFSSDHERNNTDITAGGASGGSKPDDTAR